MTAGIKRGGITRAGNIRARRVLIEGAWSYRFPARVSSGIQARLDGLPRSVREIAWKGQIRLCARYRKLIMAGKRLLPSPQALGR
ncbi:transposase [Rhizobium leguminosarum]|nr:transposase [Rhizobium leguminosarum]